MSSKIRDFNETENADTVVISACDVEEIAELEGDEKAGFLEAQLA